jgi:D-arabinose 1-dehydrogenase-like Zn-dependent alcohol dehydrogenase
VYPFVPGHEVVGRVVAVGARAGRLHVGQRVATGAVRARPRRAHSGNAPSTER